MTYKASTQALGCEMLQVGSTPDASTSGDYDVIARDLRELADEAAAQVPPIRMYVFPSSHLNLISHIGTSASDDPIR